MKALLLPSVHGVLAVKERTKKLLGYTFSDLTVKELANNYLMMQKGEAPEDLLMMLNTLKGQGVTTIEVEDPTYKPIIDSFEGLNGSICDDITFLKECRENMIQFWMDSKIPFTAKKITDRAKILSEIMIKAQIAESATQEDFQVKQAVDTIDDIDKSVNFFSSRLREWYGLHFPELTDKLIGDNIQFARFVSKVGLRSNFTPEILQREIGLKEDRAIFLTEKAQRSMGGLLSPTDFQSIQDLANRILDLRAYHEKLENYISETLGRITPNLKAVIGAPITAKLISIAGSLERLSSMSSSTIQVLGAEKALFKAMRAGGDTPKYGIIFQWNKIRGEKSYLRGKVARMVAGKISILAKVDYYKGEFIGDQYKANIDKKIAHIQHQFPKPPVKKEYSREKSNQYSDRSDRGKKYGGKQFDRDKNSGYSKGGKGGYSKGGKGSYSKGGKGSYSKGAKGGYSKGGKDGYSKGGKSGYSKGGKSGYSKGGKSQGYDKSKGQSKNNKREN